MTGNTRLVITSSRSVMCIVSNTLFDDVYVLMYFIQEDVYIVNEYDYQLSTVFPFFYTHLFEKSETRNRSELNSAIPAEVCKFCTEGTIKFCKANVLQVSLEYCNWHVS